MLGLMPETEIESAWLQYFVARDDLNVEHLDELDRAVLRAKIVAKVSHKLTPPAFAEVKTIVDSINVTRERTALALREAATEDARLRVERAYVQLEAWVAAKDRATTAMRLATSMHATAEREIGLLQGELHLAEAQEKAEIVALNALRDGCK